MPYDLFISYSRRDNAQGRITQLVEHIKADFASFDGNNGRELVPFFDQQEIAGKWEEEVFTIYDLLVPRVHVEFFTYINFSVEFLSSVIRAMGYYCVGKRYVDIITIIHNLHTFPIKKLSMRKLVKEKVQKLSPEAKEKLFNFLFFEDPIDKIAPSLIHFYDFMLDNFDNSRLYHDSIASDNTMGKYKLSVKYFGNNLLDVITCLSKICKERGYSFHTLCIDSALILSFDKCIDMINFLGESGRIYITIYGYTIVKETIGHAYNMQYIKFEEVGELSPIKVRINKPY